MRTTLLFCLVLSFSSFAITKTTTVAVGVFTPVGNPAINDDIIVNHNWSAGWSMNAAVSTGFAGTITINDGGNFRATNTVNSFAGEIDIKDGGHYEVDGDFINLSGSINVDDGGVFRNNSDFNSGDDAIGASLTVNGSVYLSGIAPKGVITIALIVAGTGNIDARSIVYQNNGSYGDAMLPVEIIRFVAKADDRGVLLQWTTASEINNDYFDVQRSIDGINFKTIGTILGNGNSSEEHNYQYVDENESNQNWCYRLKQVDFDGEINYSHIAHSGYSGYSESSFKIMQKSSTCEFFILTFEKVQLTIEVYDLSGKINLSLVYNGTKGGRCNFLTPNRGNCLVVVKSKSKIISKKAYIF
jgi:hypothetical protein